MKRASPTLEGFGIIFRRPSFGLGEIAWRWSFGGAAAALVLLSLMTYLDTLPVTNADLFLLRTQNPTLVGRALADIFHGSGPRFTAAFIVLAICLAFIWIILASWGRAVTLRNLLDGLRDGAAGTPAYSVRALWGLNFFRVVVALAVGVGCVAAFVLGGLASPDKDPSPGLAFFVFCGVFLLVALAGAGMNWFLSLAALFVVRDGRDTFGAMGAAVGFCRDRMGAVLAVSTWFGLAHGVAMVVAYSALAFPMAFAGLLPGSVVLGGMLVIGLLYFAVVDLLYLGRLAAYVYIVESPEIKAQPEMLPPSPGPPQQSVDRSELILSDVPVS